MARVAVAAKENLMDVEPAGVGGGLQNRLGGFDSHNVLHFIIMKETLENNVVELLQHFEAESSLSAEPITIADLEKRAFDLIETHKKNPKTYLTTEDWQTGYLHGYLTCCSILRNRSITVI